jgi:alginate O-acetyltransferase complex protein AlgI
MLFQSLSFLFVFLPIALTGYYCTRNLRHAKYWLIAASLAFYAHWDRRLLPMLLLAVAMTWLLARLAIGRKQPGWLIAGIAGNLALLAFFKYSNFVLFNFGAVTGTPVPSFSIVLPLAISFFTFHQISFLVDIWRNQSKLYDFSDYLLYIVFFPHLIAGPIVRHNEFMPQIEARRDEAKVRMAALGLALFTLGLAKKLWIADPLSIVSDGLFAQAATGPLSFPAAAACALAFALQIYFDFSGYTDMAIGLGRLFGYELPQNFDAPYKATSLIEFWRRWHMTLSRYLRDYLYIPLGGGYHGRVRQALALLGTMVLGGLWHGAAWTFVAWGLVHGLALVVNHQARRLPVRIPTPLAWLLTFTVVVTCFVIFRATSLGQAMNVLSPLLTGGMADRGAVGSSDWLMIAAALLLATVGPTNHHVVETYLRPRPLVAVAIGLTLCAVVITVLRSSAYAPFLYFQF